ncbi:aspartate carbamoyltransferase regulatory subunit, partial [Proteiniclasticum ruminis]
NNDPTGEGGDFMINVSDIKKGIVLDHIRSGSGFRIYRELGLMDIEQVVVLLQNVPSDKMGKKDLIKIETDLCIDLTVLGLLDPNITVNYIEDGMRVKKIKLMLPEKVTGIMKCKNPRCITHQEEIPYPDFFLSSVEKKMYRCSYCDTYTSL